MSSLYDKWNERVIRTVPPHRLVVFDTGQDGWEKLCQALNVSIPTKIYRLENGSDMTIQVPYPHVNTGHDYTRMVMAQKGLALVLITTPVLTAIMLLLCLYKKCKLWSSRVRSHRHND